MDEELIPYTPEQQISVPTRKRRPGAMNKADRKKAQLIALEVIKNTGNPRAAAMAAKVEMTTISRWIDSDPRFSKAYDDANKEANMALFAEGWKRATIGEPEFVVSAGKLVYGADGQPLVQMRKSDQILALYLKARMRDVFGEKTDINLHVMPKQYFVGADQEGTED